MNPLHYYQKQFDTYTLEIKILNQKLSQLSILRILIFIGFGFGTYFFFKQTLLALVIAGLGISAFIYVLSIYTNTKNKNHLAKALAKLNDDEIKIASGDFHNRDNGSEFQNPKHFYSLDIDLFGRGSFYQFINRTTMPESSKKLADALTANNILNIETRQDAIKELQSKPEWRQNFTALSSLIQSETSTQNIIHWITQYQPFLPKTLQWLPLVTGILSVVLFSLFLFKIISVLILGYWLFFGLLITLKFVKKTNELSVNGGKTKEVFKQYALLLNLIEKENFTSQLLQEKQQQIKSENKKASVIFNEFSKPLDALDNRNNIISAIFGNGYLLWDIKQSYRIEQWIKQYHTKISDWFEVITFFDAYNSLGNFAFNHPQYVYPKIEYNKNIMSIKNLGHPLLNINKRIDNNLTIQNQQFFIVTGANMAGKSTFLRTVSLHIVMANVGLPVCAKSSNYAPVKLITSMRTSDSLVDDSSYFFSELTRLKYIVDAIKNEPYFIILDEILKGTNSVDKATGSRKFVEKLVASNTTGIIATHDLSLCDIEKELHNVENYYFDAEIINDELHFDYMLKTGICKNMNASFLLKKMEII